MKPAARAQRQLDPQALEARTQAIGRELFALARQHHAHLSVVNRWTAQILSWCLADPALKSNVLRFIDVLPSLQHPRSVARHLREYFPSRDHRLPSTLRLGATLARPGLFTAPAVSRVITELVEQVARQFIAESQPDAAAHTVTQLASRGLLCSFDLLGEQVLSEPEAERYTAQCQELLRDVARAYAGMKDADAITACGPRLNLSVKPSALTPRFDPISPAHSVERALQRLLPIFRQADQVGALINLDTEQADLRDLTLALARELLVHPKIGKRVALGIVIQAYLRDAGTVVEELLAWLATHERPLTIRLVKGAYWDYEVALAAQTRRPAPVYEEKARTDRAFEHLTRRLLGVHPLVTTAIASHNIRSIAHAMAAAEALGLAKQQVEFQLLYGMGDALAGAIVARGYPVRVYTPVGALIPGMAYLVRRILENTANESFLRQDFLKERNAAQLLSPPTPSDPPPAWDGRTRSHQVWVGEPLTDFSKASEQARMAGALTAVRDTLGASYVPWLDHPAQHAGETLRARNPANPDEVLGSVSLAGQGDVDRAVAIAESAQRRWAETPIDDRTARLRRVADLLRVRRFELAAWEVLEVGKTWREADADVVEAIDYLEYYCHAMEQLAAGKPLVQVPGERNTLAYAPRGVAVVIAPWNFPAAILTGMASAALASGCAVILKPAEQSSVVAAHVAEVFREVGCPPGVVQFLPGRGEEVGAALVRHPGTRVVLFTGSKAVGLSIVQACAAVPAGQRFIKHVVAEMGGKNALIIDEDADLDAAVQGTLASAFGYAGQKCSAASRVIVLEAVYTRFLDRLIQATDRLVLGDPADPSTDVGPLIEEAAQRRLIDAISQAERSATVAYRYPAGRIPRRGHFVGPAIVTDVPPQHPLATEELFGPLVCVFRVRTWADALALANDTDYALTGGLYSRSPSRLARAIQAFDVGNLYLNRPITGAVVGRQPFGGHRLSGLGTKAGGPDYLLQLLLPKTVCTNTARHGMPLE